MGRVCRGRSQATAGSCKTVLRMDKEAASDDQLILECNASLSSARRAAVVQHLVDVKASNSEG